MTYNSQFVCFTLLAESQKKKLSNLPTAATRTMRSLTPKQIQIIKDTWEVPKKDLEGSGEAILFRYFEKYPHNQQKFASFKNIELASLKVS